MAEKKGAGGKPQEFDKHSGRYVSDYVGIGTEDLCNRQIIELPDEILPKSLSAKWANYDIAMPDGTVAHFVEGSKLHNIEVFAGKGTKKPIRDIDRLVKTYGGKPEDWMKVKGIGTISYRGEENKAEIHWYQANGGGKEELKFKRYV